jgi:hypothetical protein
MSSGRRSKAAPESSGKFDALLDALRELKAQSEDGFEGLFRDILQHIARRTFRLVKSGPQHGKDILSESDPALPGVAFEAKRFAAKTPLSLDAVKSKLHEALETLGTDVWGLVRSGEMREPDWSELREIAQQQGVTLVCLDWRSAPSTISVLAAACAAARHIVAGRLNGDFESIFDSIQAHPDYNAIVDELRRQLTAPEVGFDIARDAASKWLGEAIGSERRARKDLRNPAAAVESVPGSYVPRKAVTDQLDKWWESGAQNPAVLLGEEGRGKSWAALAWCAEKISDENAPLILVASAKDIIETADPAEVISRLLSRCMQSVSAESLARRVSRWCSRGAPIRIVLLIDGLNERWDYRWQELVSMFEDDPWNGCVSLLLTSRLAYWEDHLGKLRGATDQPISEIKVPDFSDAELDQLLERYDLSRQDLPSALVALIRIPRFAALAISLREKLRETGDITVARLVLEDWRSRLEHRGGELRIDYEGLLSFVAGIGKDVLNDPHFSISIADIHSRLSADSGESLEHYRNTISEITSGSWLESSGSPHRFKVSRKLLPYVIGMDLARSVEALNGEGEIKEIIAGYEEQLRGADIAVSILRAAASVTFARGRATPAARKILLQTWIGQQNFNLGDFVEFWPLIALDPAFFAAFAEAHFREHPVGRGEGEILVKGLANAAKAPQVHDELVRRLPAWAGAYGLDPISWLHGKPVDGADERRSETEANLADWRAIQASYHFRIDQHLRQDEKDYLARAAQSIISYLPRTPFKETLVTAAVASTLMGGRGLESLHWLLRLNSHDPVETEDALLEECRQLRGLGGKIGPAASDLLLQSLATPRSLSEISDSAANNMPRSERELPGWPVIKHGGKITWPAAKSDLELEPLTRAERLARFAPWPEANLDTDDQELIVDAVRLLDPQSPDAVTYLSDHDRASASFARWAPAALADFVQGIFAVLLLGEDKLALPADFAEQSSIVLKDDELARLRTASLSKLASLAGTAGDEQKFLIPVCQNVAVASVLGRPAKEQIDTLEKLLPVFAFSVDIACLLTPLTEQDLKKIFDLIDGEADERIVQSWLNYLSHVRLKTLPPNANILIDIAAGTENKSLRQAAMVAISNSEDEALKRAFVDSGWSFQEGQDRREAISGSYLITDSGGHLPFEEARSRVMPEALAYLAEERGIRDDEVRAVYDDIDGLLDQKLSRTTHSYPIYAPSFETDSVWTSVVRLDDGAIVKKLKRVARERAIHAFLDGIPIGQLLPAIFKEEPAEGVEIWKLIDQSHQHSGINVSGFDHIPFGKFCSSELEELRGQLINAAKSDYDLSLYAFLALKHGHEDWLVSLIEENLGAPDAAGIARALTLAGFLDATAKAEELWSGKIDPLSLSGWLDDVRRAARSSYKDNKDSCFWFERFFTAKDPAVAFAAMRLFRECKDRRAGLWGQRIVNEHKDAVPKSWLVHLDATQELLKAKTKKRDDSRKKTLCHTRTLSNMAPWL